MEKIKIRIKDQHRWGEEVFSLLSWFDSEKVSNAKIMVVGAGALGNEVLKNLALFGIGNILIVDYDTIEYSNLSRSVLFRPEDAREKRLKAEVAAQRIKEINPDLKTMAVCGNIGSDVGLGLISEMDVIIGCLDSRYARYLLNIHAFRANKPWIDGGIENMEGYVRVFKPGVNCYECSLTAEELQYMYLKTGCQDIAKINNSYGRIATTPVSSSIIGAIQVQEALKIIHQTDNGGDGQRFKTLEGKLFKYDGMFMISKTYNMLSYNDDCLSHDVWSPVIKMDNLSAGLTIGETLRILKSVLNTNQVVINMRNNKFIAKITEEKVSGKSYEVLMPESKISNFLAENSHGLDTRERIFQDFIENIGDDFPYKYLTLNQVGIPFYDIIQVTTSRGFNFVELSGDKKFTGFN